jgi:sec-independent protein translocase protein TatC
MDPVVPLGPGAWRLGTLLLLAALAVATGVAVVRAGRRVARPLTFLGHVEELRHRILVTTGAFLVGTTLAFALRIEPWRGAWRIVFAVQDNIAAQLFRVVARDLVPRDVRLVSTSPLDGFMVEFQVAMAIGAFLALPVLLAQVVGFFAPGLQERERRALLWMLGPAMALFALGAAFAYRFVLPFMFRVLYGYTDALGAEPLLRLRDFVAFSFGLMLVFGLAFQTPLLMAGLSRFGIVRSQTWRRIWRYAIVAILIVSAVVTDPSIPSQLMVAAPLSVLYGLGVLAAWLVERKAKT